MPTERNLMLIFKLRIVGGHANLGCRQPQRERRIARSPFRIAEANQTVDFCGIGPANLPPAVAGKLPHNMHPSSPHPFEQRVLRHLDFFRQGNREPLVLAEFFLLGDLDC